MEVGVLQRPVSVQSSEASGSGSGSPHPRVRTVRLTRRPSPASPRPAFGFSLRGGREHGTGFFVSAVEPGSEAMRQGLRIGDQIVRINGFPVEDAVHQEILHFIQAQNHLSLKVRTVGMLPVKEKKSDPLTWCIVEDERSHRLANLQTLDRTIMGSSSNLFTIDDMPREVRMFLNVASRNKLGCGVCKGPEWHPGIFVQFTKENGLAQEAGLRPGDQILECNGVKFMDIPFNEAVSILKASKQLDLVIRKGAGSDLFPGESSGYNSSASSVTGDQSPSWEDTKRLSVVKEEAAELEDRLGQLNTNHKNMVINRNKDWDQIEYEWEKAEREEMLKQLNEKQIKKTNSKTITGSCTVIHLGENGVTTRIEERIKDIPESESSTDNESKVAEICMISKQQETTTVVVEVHRTDEDSLSTPPPPRPPSPADFQPEKRAPLTKSASSSSCMSVSSGMSLGSLSSAISQELQRRQQKREVEGHSFEEPRKDPLKAMGNEKRQQHEQLMEEFKLAHKRMFAACTSSNEENKTPAATPTHNEKNRTDEDRHVPIKENGHPDHLHQEITVKKDPAKPLPSPKGSGTTLKTGPPPPPPPPLPTEQSRKSSSTINTLPFSGKGSLRNAPVSPIPDYDSSSVSSSSSTITNNLKINYNTSKKANNTVTKSSLSSSTTSKTIHVVNKTSKVNGQSSHTSDVPSQKVGDSVEMESIESFKLTNPPGPPPKPPATYFATERNRKSASPTSSSSSSEKMSTLKKDRPVSVVIGEYPSGVERRQPNKLDFLLPSATDGKSPAHMKGDNVPINNLLQNELAQTLSRSNLKKRTESHENLVNGALAPEKSVNGTVTISINSQIPNGVKQNSTIGPQNKLNTSFNNSSYINNYDKKVPLFNGDVKNNVKPSILQAAEKLSNTLNKNSVTIIVSSKNDNSSSKNS